MFCVYGLLQASSAAGAGLYSSWARRWADGYGLSLTVVAHAEFDGVTSAIHLIVYCGVDDSCFMPHGALA